jgi:hypothetical protein
MSRPGKELCAVNSSVSRFTYLFSLRVPCSRNYSFLYILYHCVEEDFCWRNRIESKEHITISKKWEDEKKRSKKLKISRT